MSDKNNLNFDQIREYLGFYYDDPDFEQIRIDLASGCLPSINGMVDLNALAKYCVTRYMANTYNVVFAKISPAGFKNPFNLETR